MPLCMRASCALLAAIPRLPAVTVYCVKPPNRVPARLRRLSLYPTQLSHFLFSKRFLEVPLRHFCSDHIIQTVHKLSVMLREILRTVRIYLFILIDSRVESEHCAVKYTFRVITDKTVP